MKYYGLYGDYDYEMKVKSFDPSCKPALESYIQEVSKNWEIVRVIKGEELTLKIIVEE